MGGHVIWNLLHELFENDTKGALPSLYRFLITSVINLVLHGHEYNVLFIT